MTGSMDFRDPVAWAKRLKKARNENVFAGALTAFLMVVIVVMAIMDDKSRVYFAVLAAIMIPTVVFSLCMMVWHTAKLHALTEMDRIMDFNYRLWQENQAAAALPGSKTSVQ